MQCKYHPDRAAEMFCASCNAPLCKQCAEQSSTGEFYCYECAMLHSVSEVGTSIRDKRQKGEEKRAGKRKRWGPFRSFVALSGVVILVMWALIIFGGKKPPARSTEFAKKGRVLLFMVDGAIKRYALSEGNRYPEHLTDLIPAYLPLRKGEASHLESLSYRKDTKAGYRLSLARAKPGQMNIILTATGVEYTAPSGGGA
jgi:hypothetical protein